MQELLIGSIAILLGSFIQGVSGFAFSLVVVPSLMMFFPPAEVVPVVIGLSIFLNTLMLLEARR